MTPDRLHAVPTRAPWWVWLALVAVLAIAVPPLVAWPLGGDYGSAAEWVTALTTAAAFAAAVIAVRVTAGTLTLERERDADRDAEQRRAQAVQVAAWIPGSRAPGRGGKVTATATISADGPVRYQHEPVPILPDRIGVTVRNGSPLPVHELRLEFYFRAPDGTGPILFGFAHPEPLVVPEATVEVPVAVDPAVRARLHQTLTAIPGRADAPPHLILGWSFTDNAGVRWRRSPRTNALAEDPRAEPD